MAPESFGPFRVVHQIGAGTLGPVFRAYDPEHDRPVAVKLFTVDLAPELVHRFVADLDRLVGAELTHPAIARPLATGILGNSPYLVEEFVEAESLDIALRLHGPAPVPDALRIAAQIAGALDFAAVSHVHHGGLHPRDVLLSNQEVRITGLGVARALEQVGITAPTRRPYAAPERVSGGVWHRFADIFGLAALMYEMLWGRRLNGVGVQAVATLEALPGGDLTALSLAFARALAEDPGGRYSRALKFVEALKNAFPADSDTETIKTSHAFPPASDVAPIADAAASLVAPSAPPEREAPAERSDIVPIVPSPTRTPELRYEPEPDLDLRASTEPEIDIAVAPTLVVPPAPTAVPPVVPPPPAPVAPVAPILASKEPGHAAEPPAAFSFGPRRHDRAQYVPPEHEVEAGVDEMAGAEAEAPIGLDRSPLSMIERSRSAMWPLAAAVMLGIAIGFAGGYVIAFRGTLTSAGDTSGAAATAQAREYTDSAVPDAAKPAPTGSSQPTAPVTDTPAPLTTPTPGASGTPPASSARDTAAGTAPTASRGGRILVRSTPAGARVAVDGHDYGVTPVAVRDLTLGMHAIRVTRDGYAVEERRIRVTRSRPSQALAVTLERPHAATTTGAASFTGGLSVDSRPAGAKVYVDGRLVGTTPLQSHSLSAGEHAIRLEHEGYRRWTSAVRIVTNEQNRVTASLER